MNCSILNNTPFAAQAFPHTDAQGVHSLALVAKGTWELAAGATNLPRLRPAERQRPIHRAGLLRPLGSLARDEFQAQVLQPRAQQPWPICEPEHVPPKPWFDLLLDACAVSPNGRPASSIDVAVDYERQGRQHRLAALRAFSPRIWIKDFGQLKASELGPSLRIPLLRPFAFGGQTLDARGNSLVDEHNPDGMGFYGTAAQAALPQLFMEEEGHGLHRGLQQAERQRGPEIAGHGIGHGRCHGDMDDVVAGGLQQRASVVVKGLADAAHGALLGMRLHARCEE